jgi:hypothetical protein
MTCSQAGPSGELANPPWQSEPGPVCSVCRVMYRWAFVCVCVCAVILFAWACNRKRSWEPPPEWLVSLVQETDSRLHVVDPSNGIDADEATAIAGVYMAKYIIGCGAADQAALDGNTWVVPLRVGYEGRKSDRTIQVDARTGAVWGLGGPSYRDFQSFRYGVLIEMARSGR